MIRKPKGSNNDAPEYNLLKHVQAGYTIQPSGLYVIGNVEMATQYSSLYLQLINDDSPFRLCESKNALYRK